MHMEHQDGDWLDSQLAETSYVPDDGFTASVLQNLPKAPARPVSIRTKVMLAAGFVACCILFLLLPGALEAARQFAGNPAVTSTFSKTAGSLLHQPIVFYSSIGAIVALLIAAVPLAKRWA
jgi:hypothetical protein